MSHSVETMAYAHVEGQEGWNNAYSHPWHINDTQNLSVPVDPGATVAEMRTAAGLDWEVKRHASFINVEGELADGTKRVSMMKTGDDYLLRSTDNSILTRVGPNWNEVNPEMFVEFFHDFCEEGSMEMNTMGSLKEGKQLFALAKVNESFSLFRGKDVVESYFLFSNPMVYGKSLDLRFTPTRVVCDNTLTVALKGFNTDLGVKLSHRQPFDPDAVKQALGIAKEQLSSYKDAAVFLGSKRWTPESLNQYYSDVFPGTYKRKKEVEGVKLNKRGEVALGALETQPGAELGEGSWWQAYNSVTYAVDHLFGKTDGGRIDSALFGSGQKTKVRALDKALEYADK